MAKHLFLSGERNPFALLHEADVRAIFEARQQGVSGRVLAEQYCVAESTIAAIVTGQTWAQLQLPVVPFHAMRVNAFWRRVDKRGVDECWNWLGKPNRDTNYGRFGWKGKIVGAHCFSYELHKGPIPNDREVAHSCDNRRCVNPAHLFAKTRLENVQEMWARGRASAPPDTARKPGEGNPASKITEAAVAQIRQARKAGVKLAVLAVLHGLHKSAVSRICNGVRWSHSYAKP